MPTVDANGCEMFYEVDDFTDPWTSDKEAVWLQHGVGRSTKFWYHWVPPWPVNIASYAAICAVTGSRQHHHLTTNGHSMNWPRTCSPSWTLWALSGCITLGSQSAE